MVQAQNTKKIRIETPEQGLEILNKSGLEISVDGFGAWSHSKLSTLRKCPLKFYLQYILKVKRDAEASPMITHVGKASHRIIEIALDGATVPEAFIAARREFKDVITSEHWEEHVALVEYNISAFMERVENFKRSEGVTRILQELRIGCTKDWKPTGFFANDVYFRGVVDLVLQLKNGDIVIIDHKYGTVAAMGLRNFQDQLDSYKVMFHKGVYPIRGATSGIHHIKEGEIVLGNHSSREDIEDTLLPKLEFFIDGAVDGLKEIGYFKHIAGSACKYCEYREECKAKKLLAVEMDSKKWFQLKKID